MLAAALDSCAGGRPRALYIEGAAGTGKSTLLAEAQADARLRGWTVFTGRSSILEAGNDLGVLRQLLEALAPLPGTSPAAVLGQVTVDSAPFGVFERVSAHLLDVAARGPVLITVDDLHWCDASSLRLLAYLANRNTDQPVALVLAGSPGELSGHRFMLDELVASCERQTLGRLTRPLLRQWVADVLGGPPDDAFVAGCLQATGGNVTLLAELLPALAARSVRPVKESLDQVESVGVAAVSRRVMSWINRAHPKALAVAQAVAVLAEDSYPVLVAQLAGLSIDASCAIDHLIKQDILSDSSPLCYVHSLTRAVVNTEMNAGLRTSLRLRASRMVRDRHAEPERAAAHLMAVDMAGDPDALDTLRAAASFALDDGRPGPALRYLRRALAEPMPDSIRAALLAETGAVEAGLGVAGSGNTLRQALPLAAEPSLRARIGVDVAYADASVGGPLRSATEIVDEACGHLSSDWLAAEAEFGLFLVYAQTGDVGGFVRRRLPRLRELAAADPHLGTLASLVDAWSDTRRGRDRAGCVRRALAALEAIDRRTAWELRLRRPAVSMLIDAEEYDLAETGGRFAHRQGPAGDATLSAYLSGRLAHGRGDLEAARAELETALSNPSAAGTTGLVRLVHVLLDLGELDAADQLISGQVPAPPASLTWAAAALTFAKAALCMARNQRREAVDGFGEAGRTLAALGIDNPGLLPWRSQAARCHAILGDHAAAKSLALEEAGLARGWGAPRALSTALAAVGVVTLDRDAGLEAVRVLDGIQAELHRAVALVDLGAVLSQTGAADQAHGHLQAGYALARMIGARPAWLRAARYLKDAGGRPDLGQLRGVSALTAQEHAVAERAVTGATNRQIADDLFLTQRTVEQYLTSAYRKLGITGRPQLAAAMPHRAAETSPQSRSRNVTLRRTTQSRTLPGTVAERIARLPSPKCPVYPLRYHAYLHVPGGRNSMGNLAGITIYGCEQDEAVLFREMAPRFGVTPTITKAAVSESNIELAFGNRCISVGHKTRITSSTLFALGQAGVEYISTRSIGYNHINVSYAKSAGISVENVAYSPDSVADYTLMLMLMAVRNAKSIILRADIHDYRLNDMRGKELRDLTVGVVGTGRIGAAVVDRLRGFGCRILAYDSRPGTAADYVPLDELLRLSDIVTLHTPLNAGTRHLLNRQRIGRMKNGAFIINTGRGSLLDTEALIPELENGRLGGAALDVLEGEEGIFYADCRNKPIESKALLRLQELPNVIISPHTAYYTDHALSDMVENSIINCLNFEKRSQHG